VVNVSGDLVMAAIVARTQGWTLPPDTPSATKV
jgi:hypothetical protein